MPSIDAIIAVCLAGLALSATPGPSMLYVLSHSVGQSRAAGLASAVGLCLGGTLLAVATALGLAALFASSAWIVTVLRYLGSAYLIWLGIGMIGSARSDAQDVVQAAPVRQKSLGAIVWQGMLVEILNPKTVLFFALFLPPFITASSPQADGDIRMQLLILGVLVPLTAIPSDLTVAYLGGSIARVMNRERSMRERLSWVGGLILIAIAVNLHIGLL